MKAKLVQLLDLARDADASLLDRRDAVEKLLVNTVFNLNNLNNHSELPELNAFLSAGRKASEETGMYGHIYRITNTETGEVYVGQSRRPFPDRIKDHLEQAKAGDEKPLYAALRETPKEQFAVQVLHVVWGHDPQALDAWQMRAARELNTKEAEMIKAENSRYATGQGYNLTAGGAGTRDMSPDSALARDLRMAIQRYGAVSMDDLARSLQAIASQPHHDIPASPTPDPDRLAGLTQLFRSVSGQTSQHEHDGFDR